jgi:hypothetical protein
LRASPLSQRLAARAVLWATAPRDQAVAVEHLNCAFGRDPNVAVEPSHPEFADLGSVWLLGLELGDQRLELLDVTYVSAAQPRILHNFAML